MNPPYPIMRSRIVVISWWSNCLGLTCLNKLATSIQDRSISVVQVGKTPQQADRFREFLPDGIVEIPYPTSEPGDHSRVLNYVIYNHLKGEDGVWFFDHDLFFEANLNRWLGDADDWFSQKDLAFCAPRYDRNTMAITQPAFWISPSRLPTDAVSFDPIPFVPRPEARQPGSYRGDSELSLPQKDTLVGLKEQLEKAGKFGQFPISEETIPECPLHSFPYHTHLSGLYLLAGPPYSNNLRQWTEKTINRLDKFVKSCPPEWLAIEDPELLQRLDETKKALSMDEPEDKYAFEDFPRGPLNFKVDRRKFFIALKTEALVRQGKRLGGAAFKLSDLGSISNEQLAQFIPAIAPGSLISLRNDIVYGKPPDSDKEIELFPVGSPAHSALMAFNGLLPLEQAANYVSLETDWEYDRSLAFARGVFLFLVWLKIVVPR
jgi:hypothetical protein